MADILWRTWQTQHIEVGHGVSALEFEQAWDDPDREDVSEEPHPEWGPYFRSLGSTADGRSIEMLWRWQDHEEGVAVWPITAYFKDVRQGRPRQRRTRSRKRS